MNIIVQKYGGSSVASEERLRLVARKIVTARRAGFDVVVVVSAMGNTTSELLDLATNLAPQPARRELDMLLSAGERISMSLLSMTVQQMGVKAISLTGPQAGIMTTDTHFNARIMEVRPERVRRELAAGKVVVVAGYQGVNAKGEVTTLGRGGSDTTAVALAAALNAQHCEICSDVDGIYSADPRIVKTARRLDEMNHEEMLEMARHGASVLNPRSVEYAWKRDLDMHARSTFDDGCGTLITRDANRDGNADVTGIAGHRELIRINTANDEESCETVAEILGDADLFLVVNGNGRRDMYVPSGDIADIKALGTQLDRDVTGAVHVETGLASASAVGLGVGGCGDTREEIEATLKTAGVEMRHLFHARHSLGAIVKKADRLAAMEALHRHFIAPPETAMNTAVKQNQAVA
ncbi:MAG TPA: aspartate kinase [Gammaproteobacteria bacterium]